MSIRPLVLLDDSHTNNWTVTDLKRARITDEHRQEAARLMKLWEAREPRRTQAEFGELFGLGNQANVGHYLHARSALNPRAAAAFARGLGCEIEDFSPRVARELSVLGARPQVNSETPVQPLPNLGSTILQLGALLAALSPMGRKLVSSIVEDVLRNPATAREAAETANAIARSQRMPVGSDSISSSFGRAQENPVETGIAPLEFRK
jgi:hypothetical protein